MHNLKKFSVLCFESDLHILDDLFITLSKYFKKVYIAKTVKESIEIIDERCDEIDLAIIGLQSEEISSFDLVQLIKTNFSHIPIILSAQSSHPEHFIKAIKLKVDRFLIKPCSDEVLLEDCKSILDSKITNHDLEETKDLNTHFEEILHNIAYVVRFDMKQNITYVNKKFLKFLEYSKDELIQENYDFLLGNINTNQEKTNKLWNEVLTHKKLKQKIAYYSKSKNIINMNVSISPVYEKEQLSAFILVGYSVNYLEDVRKNIKIYFSQKTLQKLYYQQN